MRRWLLVVVVTLGFASSASAQDWAKKMFNETTHDFGAVARGSDVKYSFTIENCYEEPVRITSVRTSCPCTSPKVDKTFKILGKGEFDARDQDPDGAGAKDGTVSVTFDIPSRPDVQPVEVQVHSHAVIRGDVVVQPGVVQFGTVDAGVGWKQQALVKYAGRSDWKILRVDSNNPHMQAQAVEKYRQPGQAAYDVGYDLIVTLDSTTPPGYLREDINLITNDTNPQRTRFPVAVEGLVVSAMSVRPNPLDFSSVAVGKTAQKNLIIQGKTPFRILSVQSTDKQCLQCKIPQDAKAVQVLPVTFTAPDREGKFLGRIRIQTDQDRVGPLDVDINAQVMPAK